jgi:MotA/TolQ/ExbB proton channel family
MPGVDQMTTQAMFAALPIDSIGPKRQRNRSGYQYLLLARFGLINLIGMALVAAAYFQGWIGVIDAADPTHQCMAIAAVFVFGLIVSAMLVWRTSGELNQAYAPIPAPKSRAGQYLALVRGRGGDGRAILAAALRSKLTMRIAIVRHIAGTLVILGLIGTVIGFIMALSGVQPEVATDVKTVAPMVSTLIQGMSVALYTTLVGGLLNIWLMVNHHVLASGTMHLVTAIVERGETDVRA